MSSGNQVDRPLEGYCLLVAEDNATNQLVVAKMIEQLGGTYDLASDGVEAIQIFDPDRHDLALLDIEMPKKSGLDVIRYIRGRADVGDGFPIVALTAFVLPEHRSKIRDAGANAVMAKPITNVGDFGAELAKYMGAQPDRHVGFEPEALMAMEESMGEAVMPELLLSLREDLDKFNVALSEMGADPDSEALASAAHGLVSLAKMSGAENLASYATMVELEVETVDQTERLEMKDNLHRGVSGLLTALADFAKRYA